MQKIIYSFQITKNIIFEVSYKTLRDNRAPYFSTVAGKFNKSKTDWVQCGQSQKDLLPVNSAARDFWQKWDTEHLHELSKEKYTELLTDIDKLKEKYNYINSDSFSAQRDLSFQEIKGATKQADRDPFEYIKLTHCEKVQSAKNGTRWACFLQNERTKNKVMIEYSLGTGYNDKKPEAYKILGAAISDAQAANSCPTIDDFMAEFGYKYEQAANILSACRVNALKLEQLGINWREFDD